jgi:hypothetical protein
MNEGRAPLIYIYINGLMSGIASYTNSDSFEAAIKELTFNSEYCDIDLFKLRVYETRLSQQNIVHNYAVDMLDVDMYDMNQIAIYNNNIPQIDFNKMLTYNVEHPDSPIMPYAVIKMVDGDERLPYVKDEDGRTCDIRFVNPALDRAYELKEITNAEYIMGCPSFESTGVNLNVQGTSSQGYPRRNFKAKFKKAKTWNYSKGPAAGQSLLSDITIDGETYKNYYMDNDYAENAFT